MKTPVAHLRDGLVCALATLFRRHPSRQADAHPHLQFFARALLAALFVASLIHAWPALVLPVDLPLRTVIGNVASRIGDDAHPAGSTEPLRHLAIIKLDGEQFRGRYRGQSPLDRCALVEDLTPLLEDTGLQTLAIDLDLSPTARRALGGPDACDLALDAWLVKHRDSLLLILPLDLATLGWARGPNEQREAEAIQSWLHQLQHQGVRFASPELDLQFGMVRQHLPTARPGLGVALAEAICASRPAARTADGLAGYCDSVASMQRAAGATEPRQISLHKLVQQMPPQNRLALNQGTGPALQALAQAGTPIRYALVGAGYSHDDEHLTPIGRLAGVEVHAAIAANPFERKWPWVDLALDLAIGVGLAYLVHGLWDRYFRQRLGIGRDAPGPAEGAERPSPGPWSAPELAYLWLALLLLVTVVLALLLQWVSLQALTRSGLWISPAGMLVGMLLDAFVMGGVHSAEHLLHGMAHKHHHHPTGHRRPEAGHRAGALLRGALAGLPSLAWFGVVLLALTHLLH